MELIDLVKTGKDEKTPKLSTQQRIVFAVLGITIPVYLIFLYFGREDTGRTVSLVLGVALVAVAIRWDLRKHIWFWGTVVAVFCLHLPLIFMVRWPHRWISGVELMPIALADCLVMLGCIWLVEKLVTVIGSM